MNDHLIPFPASVARDGVFTHWDNVRLIQGKCAGPPGFRVAGVRPVEIHWGLHVLGSGDTLSSAFRDAADKIRAADAAAVRRRPVGNIREF